MILDCGVPLLTLKLVGNLHEAHFNPSDPAWRASYCSVQIIFPLTYSSPINKERQPVNKFAGVMKTWLKLRREPCRLQKSTASTGREVAL